MEAAKFQFKQKKEKAMDEQQQWQQQEAQKEEHQQTPAPESQEKFKKVEQPKPDPNQGLSEDELLQWAVSILPDYHATASVPSTELHLTAKRILEKHIAAKKYDVKPPDEKALEEIKKKVHKYRIEHGLEQATSEDLESGEFKPMSEMPTSSSGQSTGS